MRNIASFRMKAKVELNCFARQGRLLILRPSAFLVLSCGSANRTEHVYLSIVSDTAISSSDG